ncbi:MAG: ABC transporter ATP-binding protein [Alphaproteobacteria bacterium]|nr:ABC transporter ATP-binding protein [Alphaproteobacteria bacterium]
MTLVVQDVTAGYGNITVLHDLSLTVADGAILGVLGRNGMGKTTLIGCLAGMIVPQAGSITLEGEDITRLPPHQRARRGITTVVQGRGIFPRLTVMENLEMGRVAAGGRKRNRLEEVFGYFPRLKERLSQYAGTMSGGEQQMLAIGRGLMTDPKVMLLDEPSDGIMPTLVQQIGVTLCEINRRENTTIVIVEQNVPMVFSMAQYCIVLEKGRLVAEGTCDDVSQSDVLLEYLAI